MTSAPLSPQAQSGHSVRFDWGATGGRAVSAGADVAVVVDVLTFTTAVGLAVERGSVVLPHGPDDGDVEAFAAQHGAVVAATGSLATVGSGDGAARLVLPSPSAGLPRELGGLATTVVAASWRNARAVADWLAREHDAHDTVVAVVAVGDRWPDGSLRPALEDLWGAGAVLAALEDHDWPGLSPEAAQAADAYRLIEGREAAHLRACAGGEELAEHGRADDVEIAAEVATSTTVPVLSDRGFVPVP